MTPLTQHTNNNNGKICGDICLIQGMWLFVTMRKQRADIEATVAETTEGDCGKHYFSVHVMRFVFKGLTGNVEYYIVIKRATLVLGNQPQLLYFALFTAHTAALQS